MKNRITIEGRNGSFGAYIVRPEIAPAPAVVVLHEVFGVNTDIREKCEELAEQGFIGVAPELYWRQETGVDLSVRSEADWQHGLRLNQAYDRDAGAKDIQDTASTVAALPECTGKVAVLGYCIGGLMTFLTAVRYGVDAAVAYHGGETEKYLGEVDGLHAPLLMHLGRGRRVHFQDRASPDQGGTRQQTERDHLQLSGSVARLYPDQWRPLQRRGSGARQRPHERISRAAIAVISLCPCIARRIHSRSCSCRMSRSSRTSSSDAFRHIRWRCRARSALTPRSEARGPSRGWERSTQRARMTRSSPSVRLAGPVLAQATLASA